MILLLNIASIEAIAVVATVISYLPWNRFIRKGSISVKPTAKDSIVNPDDPYLVIVYQVKNEKMM